MIAHPEMGWGLVGIWWLAVIVIVAGMWASVKRSERDR